MDLKTKLKAVDKFGESELKLRDIVDYIMRLVAVQISTIQIPDIDAYQKYEIDDILLSKVNSGDLSNYAKNEILKSIVSEIEGKLSAIGEEVAGSQKVTGAINNRVSALASALHSAIEQNQKEHEDIKKRIPSIKGLAAKSDLDTQILKIKNAILDQVRKMIDDLPSGSTMVINSGSSGGGSGDVTGPASSTDNAIARFDSTTGKIIQNSGVIVSDANAVSGVTQLDVDNVRIDANTISTTNTDSNLILQANGTGRLYSNFGTGGHSGGMLLDNTNSASFSPMKVTSTFVGLGTNAAKTPDKQCHLFVAAGIAFDATMKLETVNDLQVASLEMYPGAGANQSKWAFGGYGKLILGGAWLFLENNVVRGLMSPAGNLLIGNSAAVGTDKLKLLTDASNSGNANFDSGLIVNEAGGNAAIDEFRVESNNEANSLWVDPTTDTVHIRDQFIYNENAKDIDWRMEGTGDANTVYLDAGNNRVGFGTATPGSKVDVAGSFQCDSITNDSGLASDVYTPTLTGVTNIAASTAYPCQWLRTGNTVTVSGKVDIDVTTGAAAMELGISLPVASNFANDYECGGCGIASTVARDGVAISADPTNNRARAVGFIVSPNNNSYFFNFSYRVI